MRFSVARAFLIAFTTLYCCLPGQLQAAPRSWTGFASDAWSNTLNWDPVGIVLASDNIHIGNLQPNADVDLNINQTIASLNLSNEASLDQYIGRELTVNGTMTLEDDSVGSFGDFHVEDLQVLDRSMLILESGLGNHKSDNAVVIGPDATLQMNSLSKLEASATSGNAFVIDGTLESVSGTTTIQALSGGLIDLDGSQGNSHLKLISTVPSGPKLVVDGPLADDFDGTIDLLGQPAEVSRSTLEMTQPWTAGIGSIINMEDGVIEGAAMTTRGLVNVARQAMIRSDVTFANNLVQIADLGLLETEDAATFLGTNVVLDGSLFLTGGGSMIDTVINHPTDGNGGIIGYGSGLTIGPGSDIDVPILWNQNTNAALTITGGDVAVKTWGSTTLNLQGGVARVVDGGSIDLPGGLFFGTSENPQLRMQDGSVGLLGAEGNGILTMGFSAGDSAGTTVVGFGSTSPGAEERQSELSAGNTILGHHGSGTLLIQEGGKANIAGNMQVGNNPGSLGTLVVDGAVAGESQTFRSELRVGVPGEGIMRDLEVGNSGEGYFVVRNGGTALIYGDAHLGRDTNGNGNLIVEASELGHDSEFLVIGDLNLGGNGGASATLFDGGYLHVTDTMRAQAGSAYLQDGGLAEMFNIEITEGGYLSVAGGEVRTSSLTRTGSGIFNHTGGTVRVDNNGSADFNTSYAFGGPAQSTQPRLVIEGGSAATVTTGFSVGDAAGTHGQAAVQGVGTSGRSTLLGTEGGAGADLHVGRFGSGGLSIEDGGYVKILDDTQIGTEAGSYGVLSVLGTTEVSPGQFERAELDVTGRGAQSSLDVGRGGHGILTVGQGGLVRVGGNVNAGTLAGSLGEIYVYTAENGLPAELEIAGNLNLGGAGEAVMYLYDNGSVTANQLNLGANSTLHMSGGLLTLDTLDADDGIANLTGGEVDVDTVIGDVNFDSVTLTPGDSPGLMEIEGSAVLNNTILEIEIGGTSAISEYDVLQISGSAIIDGTLDIQLYDLGQGTFAPEAGDQFSILTADEGLSGRFSSLTYDPLPKGLAWDITYNQDEIQLRVISLFDTADFDFDGDVDSKDLAQWERDFGSKGGVDTDADNDADGSDFLAWQRQYTGSSRRASLATTAVPEPAGLVLMLMGLVGMLMSERR